jgi:hypothetical protein
VGEDLGRWRELGDLATCLHDRNEVADLDRFVDVVGHE